MGGEEQASCKNRQHWQYLSLKNEKQTVNVWQKSTRCQKQPLAREMVVFVLY